MSNVGIIWFSYMFLFFVFNFFGIVYLVLNWGLGRWFLDFIISINQMGLLGMGYLKLFIFSQVYLFLVILFFVNFKLFQIFLQMVFLFFVNLLGFFKLFQVFGFFFSVCLFIGLFSRFKFFFMVVFFLGWVVLFKMVMFSFGVFQNKQLFFNMNFFIILGNMEQGELIVQVGRF